MAPSHERHAARFGLVITNVETFPIRRTRRGSGFRYVDERTGRSPGRAWRAVIDPLAAPPGWKLVRCAADLDSHILVHGEDEGGRRQYLYHPKWEAVRDAVKAERLLRFGRALPRLRARVAKDLKRDRLDKRRVAAAAARLVDRGAMRPGNEVYALSEHRGATTLIKENVVVRKDEIALDYVGKSGREHRFTVRDKAAARVLRGLKRMPAGRRGTRARLFRFRNGKGRTKRLTAAKLNAYLARAAACEVSAKDFRTFTGSVAALRVLLAEADAKGEARERAIAAAAEAASERLRNTVAVARESYILPSLIDDYRAGRLPPSLARSPSRAGLDRNETALMRHIEGRQRDPAT